MSLANALCQRTGSGMDRILTLQGSMGELLSPRLAEAAQHAFCQGRSAGKLYRQDMSSAALARCQCKPRGNRGHSKEERGVRRHLRTLQDRRHTCKRGCKWFRIKVLCNQGRIAKQASINNRNGNSECISYYSALLPSHRARVAFDLFVYSSPIFHIRVMSHDRT
uniref:Uncharacterized protein n=1 Tax=Aegilops tauschii subsp. strangulata TaxID=200361 RepID=A0A453HR31_AEGTS